jgi:hypothetical protein
MALGIASTAMPFARTPTEQAERWLRVLRMHGEVGVALQALGVSEGPLGTPGAESERERPADQDTEREPPEREPSEPAADGRADVAGSEEGDAIAQVTERAVQIATRRGAAGVTTSDLLIAVMDVYGAAFDQVLRAHGTDREEVLERLGASTD